MVERVCALCEKCINNGDQMACVGKNAFGAAAPDPLQAALQADKHVSAELDATALSSDEECDECRRAKDPNELYGPAGDLLPGQLVSYTIAYENVGQGDAFGVFIVDKLDPAFDLSTVSLPANARLSLNARTIFWDVGDLAPKGELGSTGVVTLTVRLRGDLASGTGVANQAVVHFPSVPEETPTNVVINTIQPLVAEAQTLETVGGQPVAIQLSGRDAVGTPLTFAVVEAPAFGTLSGSAPDLVYTPPAGFSGGDRLRLAELVDLHHPGNDGAAG